MKFFKDRMGFGVPVTLGIAAIAAWYVFVYQGMATAAAGARSELDTLRGRAETATARGVPSEPSLASARAMLETRQKELDGLAAKAGFKPPKWAQDAIGAGAARAKFPSLLSDEEKAFEGLLKRSKTRLGFPEEPVDEAVAREYVLRLAMVSTLLKVLQGPGVNVKTIETIDPFADAFDSRAATAEEGAFIAPFRVKLTFRAPAKEAFNLLHQLQAKAAFFGLAEFTLTPPQSGGENLKVDLTVEGYVVDTKGALPTEAEE